MQQLEPERAQRYGELQVLVFRDGRSLAARAAQDLATFLAQRIRARGQAAVMVATGNSQLEFMAALRSRKDIEWGRVSVFHLDEYLGISEAHPASFRRYIRERLTDVVRPREFFGIEGDAADVAAEIERYTRLLREHRPDACVMGIGENGHLAFNDPPADFDTQETMRVVTLDEACRRQQLGEGWFPTLDDVPRQALTLTVPALLTPQRLVVVVPERRKAPAVKAALQGPVTPDCPASILQHQPHAVLYLDEESASLLEG
ncbi:MAG: glucosamine-6-phosphate deaminase [Anaerolineae bacterium]|nr:glucosamine-6-phosphate deaminase [Anaerolineae bacterium]